MSRLVEVGKNKQIWYYSLLAAICWIPAVAFGTLWGIPYISHLFHASTVMAGEIMLLFWLGLIMSGPILGYVSENTGRRLLPFWICFSVGLVSSFLLLIGNHEPTWLICAALFCLGISTSGQALAFAGIKDLAGPKVYGTASGLTNMVVLTVAAITQPTVGLLVNWHGSGVMQHGAYLYTASDYQFGFILLPIAFAIGMFVLLVLAKEPQAQFGTEGFTKLEKT